jgi:hypothetical protein
VPLSIPKPIRMPRRTWMDAMLKRDAKLSRHRSRAGARYGVLEPLTMGNIGLRRLIS